MKKALTLILSLVLIATMSFPSLGADSDYSDVAVSDWYYGSLIPMSANKIISGYPDGTFRASDTLQVDQFLAMICRLTGNDVGLGDTYWAQNYIDFAEAKGWLDGLNFDSYNEPINRFETARLTVKAMGLTEEDYPLEFLDYAIYVNDSDSIPSNFKNDVLVNYALGITRGYPDGTFQGYNTLTRAESAVISHRIYNESVRKPPLVPSKTEELIAILPPVTVALAPLQEEMTMEDMMMAFFAGGGGGGGSAPAPVALPDTPLEPEVAVITENVLADIIIEMVNSDTGNQIAAGYDGESFNLNLYAENEDSLLLYTAQNGNSFITIDLMTMTDETGEISSEAIDLIRIICVNVNQTYGEDMLTWILQMYKNRSDIPEEGESITLGSSLMGISSLAHDHNVLKVTISTGFTN